MKFHLLLFLFPLLFTQPLVGQKAKIDAINAYVAAIKADSTLKKVDSSYAVFANIVVIKAFLLNDSVVKITKSVVHLSNSESEFYFKNGVVVYVRIFEKRFSEPEPEYEKFYYFDKNRLIKTAGTGEYKWQNTKELTTWIRREVASAKPILLSKYWAGSTRKV